MYNYSKRGNGLLTKHFETKPALGGDATITLVGDSKLDFINLFSHLWQDVFLFERRFSRFLPGSELSAFNRRAGVKQYVSPEFKELLEASIRMSKLSDGVYNPFILPALQRAGYKNSAMPGYENDLVDDHSNKRVVEASKLQLKDNMASIPYGTAIDMGGCGKGYLADKLADKLDHENLVGYWISLSGDMVVAGLDEKRKSWQVNIQSANSATKTLKNTVKNNGKRLGITTSGTFRRHNQQGSKKKWHHLIDPRTGKPAETDILLVTIVDKSCLHADVYASCAAVVGSKRAKDYLIKRGVEAACIQTTNRTSKLFGELIEDGYKPEIAKVIHA